MRRMYEKGRGQGEEQSRLKTRCLHGSFCTSLVRRKRSRMEYRAGHKDLIWVSYAPKHSWESKNGQHRRLRPSVGVSENQHPSRAYENRSNAAKVEGTTQAESSNDERKISSSPTIIVSLYISFVYQS